MTVARPGGVGGCWGLNVNHVVIRRSYLHGVGGEMRVPEDTRGSKGGKQNGTVKIVEPCPAPTIRQNRGGCGQRRPSKKEERENKKEEEPHTDRSRRHHYRNFAFSAFFLGFGCGLRARGHKSE
jgi:hypothetical protein